MVRVMVKNQTAEISILAQHLLLFTTTLSKSLDLSGTHFSNQ